MRSDHDLRLNGSGVSPKQSRIRDETKRKWEQYRDSSINNNNSLNSNNKYNNGDKGEGKRYLLFRAALGAFLLFLSYYACKGFFIVPQSSVRPQQESIDGRTSKYDHTAHMMTSSSLSSSGSPLSSTTTDYSRDILDLRDKLGVLNEIVDIMEKKIFKHEHSKVSSTVDHDLKDMNHRIANNDARILELKAELAKLDGESKAKATAAAMEKLESEVKLCKTEVSKKADKADLDSLKSDVSYEFNSSSSQIDNKFDQMRVANTDLNSLHAGLQYEVSKLKDSMESIDVFKVSLNSLNETLIEKIEVLNSALSRRSEKLVELEKAIYDNSKVSSCVNVVSCLGDMNKKIDDNKASVETFKAELFHNSTTLTSELSSMASVLSSLRLEVTGVSSDLKAKVVAIKKVENDLSSIQLEIKESLEKRLGSAFVAEVKALELLNSTLYQSTDELRKTMHSLTIDVQELQTNVKSDNGRLDRLDQRETDDRHSLLIEFGIFKANVSELRDELISNKALYKQFSSDLSSNKADIDLFTSAEIRKDNNTFEKLQYLDSSISKLRSDFELLVSNLEVFNQTQNSHFAMAEEVAVNRTTNLKLGLQGLNSSIVSLSVDMMSIRKEIFEMKYSVENNVSFSLPSVVSNTGQSEADIKQYLDNVFSKQSDLVKDVQDLFVEVSDLKDFKAIASSDLASMKDDVSQSKVDILSGSHEVNELKLGRSDFSKRLGKVESERNSLQSVIHSLETQVAENIVNSDSKQSSEPDPEILDRLAKLDDSLDSTLKNVDRRISESEARVEELTTTSIILESKLKELDVDQDLQDIKDRIANNDARILELKAELAKLDGVKKQLAENVDSDVQGRQTLGIGSEIVDRLTKLEEIVGNMPPLVEQIAAFYGNNNINAAQQQVPSDWPSLSQPLHASSPPTHQGSACSGHSLTDFQLNYASLEEQASVVESFSAKTFHPTPINEMPGFNLLPTWLGGKKIDDGAGTYDDALTSDMSIGACWPMTGTQGNLTIKLRSSIRFAGFSLGHVLRKDAVNITSAPKDFSVYGRHRLEDVPVLLLDSSSYSIKENRRNQFFWYSNKDNCPLVFSKPIQFITVNFKSNYGNSEYTCVYNVGVYGVDL